MYVYKVDTILLLINLAFAFAGALVTVSLLPFVLGKGVC